MTTTARAPRTYGNWRRPTSPGLLGLGALGTFILFGGLIAAIFTVQLAGLLAGLAVLAAVATLVLVVRTRDRHHRNLFNRVFEWVGFRITTHRREHLYRSGPVFLTSGVGQLPGLASKSRLHEFTDTLGRNFAMLYVPATRHYTVVLTTEPDGSALVDDAQIDQWVAGWGLWLTDLADEPGIEAASVTIETSPDTGVRLRREVETNLDPDAPPFALAVLRESVEAYPRGSATTTAAVALTFSAAARVGGRRRKAEEVARDLAARLPHLAAGLTSAGAGAARPMTVQELCETIRSAYSISSATRMHEAYAVGETPELLWTEVGPAAHVAEWDHYRHDDAVSCTWSMTVPPRGNVQSSILARLLSPHRDIDRKRVTLLYRPIDSARTAALVEADLRTAAFLASTSERPTARSKAAERAAEATAHEEASGAGLVNFGLLVTATVTSQARLADAQAAVENLGATARLRLRPVYGSQDSAFAAALPLGLVLPRHLKVPAELSGRL